jgi:cardiolipin synthase
VQGFLRHIPNLLTLARIILLVPFLDYLLDERYGAALAVFFLAALTDMLDGFLARHFDWRTWLGSVLDPLADKLMVVVSYTALTWAGILPLWFCVLILLRDAVILAGSFAYWRLVGHFEGNPTWLGKITTFLAMAAVLLALFDRAWLHVPAGMLQAAFWLVAVAALASTWQYIRFGLMAARNTPERPASRERQ